MIYNKLKSILLLCSFIYACKSEHTEKIIAKAGNSKLNKKTVDSWINSNVSNNDSIELINSKIKHWAEVELLAQEAKKKISDDVREEIEEKVNSYRNELLNGYLLKESEDILITDSVISKYYDKYKDNFKLNKEIVKLQYIKFNKDSVDNYLISEVSKLFKNNSSELINKLHLEELENVSDYKIKDSTWSYFSEYYNKLPFPKISNNSEFLKRTNFLRLHDSINVYLVKILDFKLKKDSEPLEFSKGKIRNMLEVQKNKDYLDKLKEDLLDKAKKNKEFQIYEKD